MADVKAISTKAPDNQLTLEQAAKKSENRKTAQQSKKQNIVAVSNTYTKVPFYYTNGKMVAIPMKRNVAKRFGLPEMPQREYDTTTDGKIKGKSTGDFKGKSIKISKSYILKERKAETKGRKTRIGKRSISLTKTYTRVWVSFRVPTDATNLDIIFWIKSKFSPKSYPEVMRAGRQEIALGLRKTTSQHKAETIANKAKGGISIGVDGLAY